MRAVLDLRVAFAREVVNLVLPFLHARQVVGQRYRLLTGRIAGGCETQQASNLLLVGEIFRRTFLEYLTKLRPELLVVLGLVLGQLLQHIQHALGQRRLHRVNDRILLQDFTGYVERQVVGIHHTLDKAQVKRQEFVGLIHDEYTLHVELEPLRCLAVIQIERRTAWHIEQRGVLELAFDLVVAPGQRIVEVVGDVLVELLILLVLHLGTRTSPQGAGAVDRFPLLLGRLIRFLTVGLFRQFDRQRDVVRVFFDDIAQAPTIGEFFLIALQVQNDTGATFSFFNGSDFEFAFALGGPVNALIGRRTGAAAVDIDFVRDDES